MATIVLKDEYGNDQQYQNIDTIAIRDPNNVLQRFYLNTSLSGININATCNCVVSNWHWADIHISDILCYQSKQMTQTGNTLEVL